MLSVFLVLTLVLGMVILLFSIHYEIWTFKEAVMAKLDDIRAVVADIYTETNRIADKVAAMQAKIDDLIAGGGATPDQLQEISDALTVERDRLHSIGADPENVVPALPASERVSGDSNDPTY